MNCELTPQKAAHLELCHPRREDYIVSLKPPLACYMALWAGLIGRHMDDTSKMMVIMVERGYKEPWGKISSFRFGEVKAEDQIT